MANLATSLRREIIFQLSLNPLFPIFLILLSCFATLSSDGITTGKVLSPLLPPPTLCLGLEDGDDIGDDEGGEDSFMQSYSDVLNKQLKDTTLQKSFIPANQTSESANKGASTSNVSNDMDVEFTPVVVDINLVKSLLDSYSSQQGLPGPASNLLGVKRM